MRNQLSPALQKTGQDFIGSPLPYEFSPLEEGALRLFFTNLTGRVFFVHSLPANVGAALLSLYSRLKNPRGLRGVFVDTFLPHLLAGLLTEVDTRFGGDPRKFLDHYQIRKLADFVQATEETRAAFDDFLLRGGTDPDFLRNLTAAKRARQFLETWLGYGHTSIARMGSLWLGFEEISLLAAKTIEWSRPGSGFLEWSTRFINASQQRVYPLTPLLCAAGLDPAPALQAVDLAFKLYRETAGQDFGGPLPNFLRRTYGHLFAGKSKDLEAGVAGETLDVCGNFLPAATLTSLAANLSGEALPQLLRHLVLDNTPETLALVEFILEEAGKVGADQFCRHFQPTPWEAELWRYLDNQSFARRWRKKSQSGLEKTFFPPRQTVEKVLLEAFRRQEGLPTGDFKRLIQFLASLERGEYDKLPSGFEAVTVAFFGVMSFRSWRDLQRQTFCTHLRTYLTPNLGFFHCEKPMPPELKAALRELARNNANLYCALTKLPPQLKQYPLALGNRIGFSLFGNLRQMEFCSWQRSKPSVNAEVRKVFLSMEESLRRAYPWWGRISRADLAPTYIFAAPGGRAIPLASHV